MLEGFTMVAGVLYCERHMVFPFLCVVWISHDSSTWSMSMVLYVTFKQYLNFFYKVIESQNLPLRSMQQRNTFFFFFTKNGEVNNLKLFDRYCIVTTYIWLMQWARSESQLTIYYIQVK